MPVVAIVGIDGSGKTTQAKILVDKLNKEGYDSVYVRPIYAFLELFPSSIKSKVLGFSFLSPRRSATLDLDITFTSPKNILYSSVRKIFIKILGYPYVLMTCLYLHFILGANRIIVCDRYFIQFLIDIYGNNTEYLLNIVPMPDVVFYMKGNLNMHLGRMNNLFDSSIKKEYYSNMLFFFEKNSQKYHFIAIDANMGIDSISNTIHTTIMESNLNLKSVKI